MAPLSLEKPIAKLDFQDSDYDEWTIKLHKALSMMAFDDWSQLHERGEARHSSRGPSIAYHWRSTDPENSLSRVLLAANLRWADCVHLCETLLQRFLAAQGPQLAPTRSDTVELVWDVGRTWSASGSYIVELYAEWNSFKHWIAGFKFYPPATARPMGFVVEVDEEENDPGVFGSTVTSEQSASEGEETCNPPPIAPSFETTAGSQTTSGNTGPSEKILQELKGEPSLRSTFGSFHLN